jgi:hypothetical protein
MSVTKIIHPDKADHPSLFTVHSPACPPPEVSHNDKANARDILTVTPTPVPHSGPRPEHYRRIQLNGTETTAELRARGVPARTARTAVKRGWYTQQYHCPQYPQDDGPGLFATLTNPYASPVKGL